MKGKKVNYIYSEKFFTEKENPSEEELKKIFNSKYYNYIVRRKKRFIDINEETKSLLKNKR